MRTRIATLLGAALLALSLFAVPQAAEAKIIIVNTGDEIFEAGPLPEPFDQMEDYQGWRAGYMCGVLGVFWAYFTSWDCRPVAYQGNSFDDSPDVVNAIAASYTEDDRQMSWWGRYGVWVLAGLVMLGGAMAVLGEEE